ncbi:MAG: hypothetical protein WC184_03960 [Acidimicrobiia bacterium]
MNRSLIFRVSSTFACVVLSLVMVACAAGTPSHEASAQLEKEVQAAMWKTRSATSGRYEFTLLINVDSDQGQLGPYETTLLGSFDNPNQAAELYMDLSTSLAMMSGLDEDLPGELQPEILHVRMVADQTWVRARFDDEWQLLAEDSSQDDVRSALLGQFEGVFEMMSKITVEESGVVDLLGDQRFYSGYLAAPADLGGISALADPKLMERLFTYKAWLDEEGYITDLRVESNFNAVAEALGEPSDQLVEMNYYLRWFDLNEPIAIAAPTL